MKLAIRYYTRGGNTKKLADAISEALNIEALLVENNLEEETDILLLGCSYYAFDMDKNVKQFIKDNCDKIKTIVLFGTSASNKSMKKPLQKLLKKMESNIVVSDEEFHCPGSFGPMHKSRPNDEDLSQVKEFALKLIK